MPRTAPGLSTGDGLRLCHQVVEVGDDPRQGFFRVAPIYARHGSVLADHKHVRYRRNAIGIADHAAPVAGHGEFELLELAQQRAIGPEVFAGIHRDDFDPRLSCGFLDTLENGQLLATVAAPGCPERHDDHLAAQAGERDRLAVFILAEYVRRRVAHRHHRLRRFLRLGVSREPEGQQRRYEHRPDQIHPLATTRPEQFEAPAPVSRFWHTSHRRANPHAAGPVTRRSARAAPALPVRVRCGTPVTTLQMPRFGRRFHPVVVAAVAILDWAGEQFFRGGIVEAGHLHGDVRAAGFGDVAAAEGTYATGPAEQPVRAVGAELVVRQRGLVGKQAERLGLGHDGPVARLGADRAIALAGALAEIEVGFEADGAAMATSVVGLHGHIAAPCVGGTAHDRPRTPGTVSLLVEAQVLYRLAMAADQAQRLDPDLDVVVDEFAGDLGVGGFGLHAFGNHRLVRHQQQRAAGNAVGEAGGEDRRGFHVDRHAAQLAQVFLERFVVFPDAAVGGVDGAGPVVVAEVADHRRHRALQGECGQRRHFRRQVVVGGAFAADRRDRQHQVAELVLLLEAAALAQEQHRLGRDRGEQVHHRRGIGAAHAEVDHGDAVGGGAGHGAVEADHLRAGEAGKGVQVAAEIGQQDVLAELLQRNAGVTRQPVADDLFFVLHSVLLIVIPNMARDFVSCNCGRSPSLTPVGRRRGPACAESGGLSRGDSVTWAITNVRAWRPGLAGATVQRLSIRHPASSPGKTMSLRPMWAGSALTLLVGVLQLGAAHAATPASTPKQSRFTQDPYPSTYRAIAAGPVLIQHATVLTGTGQRLDDADVLMRDGKIVAVGTALEAPADATRVDGTGKWVTPGIIDVHSHLGVYPSPGVSAHSDGNEATSPVTPNVWAEHSIWPQDPGFLTALAGGITSLQVLPGSANLIGGRGVTLKNVPATTYQAMKFPGAPWGLKMACGENPKRVYGQKGGPSTRMANVAGYRAAFIDASEYLRKNAPKSAPKKKHWWSSSNGSGADSEKDTGGKRDLKLDTLAGAINGDIRVHIHCYRADEMATMLDLAKEFGFKIAAFHHAVEAYKISDRLAQEGVCGAMWADWWGFKMEAFDGVQENIALVDRPQNSCAIVHSDSE